MTHAEPGKSAPIRWEKRLLLLLGLVYAALAVTYSFVIPLGYGPDEPRHVAYIKRLVEKRELPRLVDGKEEDGAIVLHPPLYYTLLAPVYATLRPSGDATAQRGMRFLSLLLVGGALLLFYHTLGLLFPGRAGLRLGAVGMAALWPHLQLEAAVINNDTLTILLGALLIWHLARLRDRLPTTKETVLAGLILAALANAKGTGATLAPVWAGWLLFRYGWRGLGQRSFWQSLLLGYAVALPLSAPWYWRNVQLYGSLVPLPVPPGLAPTDWQTGHVYTPLELLKAGLLFVGPFWHLVGRAIGGLFLSVWTQVGWFPNALNAHLYAILGLLLAAACIGHAKILRAVRGGEASASAAYPPALRAAFWAFAIIYLNAAFMAVFIHIGFYQGGRYLLPALWGFVVFLVLGLECLCRSARAQAYLFGGTTALFLALNGLCLYNLITYLNPLYGPK